MLNEGSRFLILFVGVVGILSGCASVPPSPANAQNQGNSGNGEYDGWLFKSLTGKRGSSEQTSAKPSNGATPAAAKNANAVQQASATTDVTSPTGPLVAGPASRGSERSPTLSSEPLLTAAAGPPPSIPNELPSPPAGAVSIGSAPDVEEKKGFELSDLAPENAWKNIKKATGYGPNEKLARESMQEGQKLFREKKYKEAAAKFGIVADRWPDTPLEEDALFLKGESEFFSDQYPKAHDTYGGLLKKYTNTRHLDTVMAREFALGRYWEQLYDKSPSLPITPNVTDGSRPLFDTFGYAVQAYERVRLNDPTGPLADDSVMATGNAYFRRGQYAEAGEQYDTLRKEYPNSEYQMMAHQLGLQAKMRLYQGTLYGRAPLDDAGEIADQALKQYGEKLGPERERVTKARAQIIEEKANRDFIIAQYYEQHAYYGAARMYYKGLIADYPTTEKAKEAKARLEAIKDKPSEPPSKIAWLTGMFGGKKE